jgi:hypothetical protein
MRGTAMKPPFRLSSASCSSALGGPLAGALGGQTPNPSIERTSSSLLCKLPDAAHVKR